MIIVGRYVDRFAQGDMGMLEGASLNAPYKFFWVFLKSVGPDHIVCVGDREEMRLPYKTTNGRDRAEIVVQDPLFGPIKFPVLPFLRSDGQPIATPGGGSDPRNMRDE